MNKVIQFLNKDEFEYDKITDKYFSNNFKPKTVFSVKNLSENDYLSFSVVYYYDYKTYTVGNYGSATNDYIISNEDFVTTYSYELAVDSDVKQVKIQVELNNDIIEIFEYYTTFDDDILSCNLDYNQSYASTYLRKVSGHTNPYMHAPTKIDIYINGIKTSPVDIINKDYEPMMFKKDLYLSDGDNTIEVVATDICGKVNKVVSNINIDCLPDTIERKELLTNFIGDDSKNISLHVGNSDLKYVDKHAGYNKDINIDTSIDSHYFKLKGANTNLYRISKNNIPKIQGDIVKRPLAIAFDYVEKIYDGTNDITNELKTLKLDNGVYVSDIHTEYNDYLNTGFVRGTVERKIGEEILVQSGEEILVQSGEEIIESYIITDKDITYKTFIFNLDNNIGYPLIDESTGNAELIFDDDSKIYEIFSNINLIRNTDGFTTIQFIYIEGQKYTVKNSLYIKYNYITNNSNSNIITYKDSDEGMLQVDFSKAFFESKDVTDEIQMITCNDIAFVGDTLGDASNNYQIANYSSKGRILRRTINPNLECLDKVYDGSVITPFRVINLDNVISTDDVYIDTTYEGDRQSNEHIFERTGSSVLTFNNSDVEDNKTVSINSLFLEGYDAKNYKIGTITSNFRASIKPRNIEITIEKIRFIRSKRIYEVDYTIYNDLKEDKLTIVYNSDTAFDIKVYGGVDKDGNSIHKAENILDIKDMFFNYSYTTNYQFKDVQSEIDLIENTNTYYWKDEVRPAEPDTERMNITAKQDNNYAGNIKLSSEGSQTSYFESENKTYKLYSGCKVMVRNINLDPSNNKAKNYLLNTKTFETTIDII